MVLNIRTIRSKIEYRLCCTSSQWRIGGGRGEGARDACPLVGPNSLIFMQFTAKICKTIAWCTSLGSLRPLANPGPATDSWQLICSLSNNIFTRLIAYIVDHVSISIKVTLSTYKVKDFVQLTFLILPPPRLFVGTGGAQMSSFFGQGLGLNSSELELEEYMEKYHLRESKVLCGIWKTTIWYRAITLSLELYWYFTFCVEMNGFKWTHERITPSQSVGQNFVYVFHTDHAILDLACLYIF